MAMKLYPPIIEGSLPAFFGTDVISVPFSMNRAVGASEVAGFYLKIKTVSGSFIADLYSENFDILDEMYVNFSLRDNDTYKKFNIGQYYKVQLAYAYNDKERTPGYYSTVGVIKYTTEPSVYIDGFDAKGINQHGHSYVGVYSQEKIVDVNGTVTIRDTTEKMYSSRFIIYNDDGSVYADSGEIIHKTQNDNLSYEANEIYTFSQDLGVNRNYYIRFEVKSINGLLVSSPRYRVIKRRSVSPDIDVSLSAELDRDNGHVKLKIVNNPVKNPIISGAFLVSRACSKNGYIWEEFKRFSAQSIVPEEWSALDCTIEQGITYKYSLQQYNENGVYSDRIISNSVLADFEDSFLYDGEKQLRIRFDPKVSSFKNTVLESKVETIGSQHPYIIRNGNVNYKDFQISGLISYHTDETHMFMKETDLKFAEFEGYELTEKNITAERLFKLNVLDWLTDGKPKLFRSSTEGNYIVRLMNVSLTPIDTLGRMVHSFSATAYEIAKFSTDNLNYYNLIDTSEKFTTQTRWMTVDLYQARNGEMGEGFGDDDLVKLNSRLVYSVSFADMFPGTIVYIDNTSIMIGATGAYRLESEDPITAVKIKKRDMNQGLFTYSYRSKATNVFNLIQNVQVEDVPCFQYIGEYPRGIDYSGTYVLQDIFETFEDARTEILHIAFARFIKREVLDAYVNTTYYNFLTSNKFNQSKMYYDMDCKMEIPKSEMDKTAIYHIRCRRSDYRYYEDKNPNNPGGPSINEDYIVDRTTEYFAPYIDYYYDPISNKFQKITPELFDVVIDGESINIFDTGKYVLKNIENSTRPNIQVNGGVITEISCAKQIITYSMENDGSSDNKNLRTAKAKYIAAFEEFKKKIKKGESATDKANAAKKAYKTYIVELQKSIDRYREDNGVI